LAFTFWTAFAEDVDEVEEVGAVTAWVAGTEVVAPLLAAEPQAVTSKQPAAAIGRNTAWRRRNMIRGILRD
jgi:hypothetical protein